MEAVSASEDRARSREVGEEFILWDHWGEKLKIRLGPSNGSDIYGKATRTNGGSKRVERRSEGETERWTTLVVVCFFSWFKLFRAECRVRVAAVGPSGLWGKTLGNFFITREFQGDCLVIENNNMLLRPIEE